MYNSDERSGGMLTWGRRIASFSAVEALCYLNEILIGSLVLVQPGKASQRYLLAHKKSNKKAYT